MYLDVFVELLNAHPVRVDRRGWATFFCPFHQDTKTPNLGVNIHNGSWRCLACNEAGHSPAVMAKKLGKDYKKYNPNAHAHHEIPKKHELSPVYPAFRDTQIHIAEACQYLKSRSLNLDFAKFMGLGYGYTRQVPNELVGISDILRMLNNKKEWLWYKAVLYGEPPNKPEFIQARFVHPASKQFRFLSWGEKTKLLGNWLLGFKPISVYLVEGLFDMLVLNQLFFQDGFRSVALCTAGASLSHLILTAIEELNGNVFVIPDNDEAGMKWLDTIRFVRKNVSVIETPDKLDPDEAVIRYGGKWLR